ncbi:hypothetical protein BGAL_0168g00130 [Botrytis galanthina]|uniref:Uncharacterized protein n=1 Tax=Botrytis galanthina TaxID=278940 RepID=A0A4S8QZJ9_9HELO|nr:hypothetical protein BGAL_0168g00130 [Botrytis galanthina]
MRSCWWQIWQCRDEERKILIFYAKKTAVGTGSAARVVFVNAMPCDAGNTIDLPSVHTCHCVVVLDGVLLCTGSKLKLQLPSKLEAPAILPSRIDRSKKKGDGIREKRYAEAGDPVVQAEQASGVHRSNLPNPFPPITAIKLERIKPGHRTGHKSDNWMSMKHEPFVK